MNIANTFKPVASLVAPKMLSR